MIVKARSAVQAVSLLVLASSFILVGIRHFTNPAFFDAIVPPYLPSPRSLVYLSGVFEVAGGVGILIPGLRQTARWGLVALLIAVFPANLHMAIHPAAFVDAGIPLWALYLRLPLQAVLIAWVYWSGRPAADMSPDSISPSD
jgi:uncharacterized membrane protein